MNGTKYSDVIELVLSILKSYELDEIFDNYNDEGLIVFFRPYFKFASGELEIQNSSIDLSRNDEYDCFVNVLTDGQQLIVAKYVTIGYLTRETYDILQMKLHLQDGDFKTYAEQKNLEAKQNALISLKEEAGWNVNKIGYNNTNVWRS